MRRSYELINFEEEASMRVLLRSVVGYKLHGHHAVELLYMLRGELLIGLRGQELPLKQERFAIINSMELHSILPVSGSRPLVLVIQLGDALTREVSDSPIDLDALLRAQEDGQLSGCSTTLMQIAAEFNKRAEGYAHRARKLIRRLFEQLRETGRLLLPPVRDPRQEAEEQARICSILSYTDEHSTEDLTLQQVAEQTHMSYYYLSHFFKDRTGMSFRDYLAMTRLSGAAEMMADGSRSMTDIAFACGFSSFRAFTEAFKKVYRDTPAAFCRRAQPDAESEEQLQDASSLPEDIRRLLNTPAASENAAQPGSQTRSTEITLHCTAPGRPLRLAGLRLLNIGTAWEGLLANVQQQIRSAVQAIPFEYIRFQGIFSDRMHIFDLDAAGRPVYCWTYSDMLLDFLTGLGLKLYIQFSYMPQALASEDRTVFDWKANISPPSDRKLWNELVTAFIRHCNARYGRAAVRTWYFEVWNEPDSSHFWTGSRQEFFSFYRDTAIAVRSVDASLKVGGPGTTQFHDKPDKWTSSFIEYCSLTETPLDFVSVHVYGEYAQDRNETYFPELSERILRSQNATGAIIRDIHEMVSRTSHRPVEVVVSEWNLTVRQRFLIRDTAFMAPYVLDMILKLDQPVRFLGYWSLSDIMEEVRPAPEAFHGGLGLFTENGIPKPGWYAMSFLSRLGPELLAAGPNWIVTRRGTTYQILTYNLAQFDALAMRGEFSSLTQLDRYNIFQSVSPEEFHFTLEGLWGRYRITTRQLDRQHGSAFDEWLNMNAPQNMTRTDLQYLAEKSVPSLTTGFRDVNGTLQLDILTVPHGCVLTEIARRSGD